MENNIHIIPSYMQVHFAKFPDLLTIRLLRSYYDNLNIWEKTRLKILLWVVPRANLEIVNTF